MEKDINKRKVLKGTRYLLLKIYYSRFITQELLLKNGADIFDKKYKSRLDNALELNKPLSQAYYLKEQLKDIWTQTNKQEAEEVLDDWIKQAKESKIPQLINMADTLSAHRTGILAWYDCCISTGKVEGIYGQIPVCVPFFTRNFCFYLYFWISDSSKCADVGGRCQRQQLLLVMDVGG